MVKDKNISTLKKIGTIVQSCSIELIKICTRIKCVVKI